MNRLAHPLNVVKFLGFPAQSLSSSSPLPAYNTCIKKTFFLLLRKVNRFAPLLNVVKFFGFPAPDNSTMPPLLLGHALYCLEHTGTVQVFYPLGWRTSSLEDETPGQYWYALDSTGMLWAVSVLPRVYRYCPEHTGIVQNIPVLPRAYRFQKQTGTAQSIPVLPRTYRYCLGVSSSRLISLWYFPTILLLDNEEFRQDGIDDLLKSSGDELCLVNMERTNDDGYNEILISQDEIEIVDVKKGLN